MHIATRADLSSYGYTGSQYSVAGRKTGSHRADQQQTVLEASVGPEAVNTQSGAYR